MAINFEEDVDIITCADETNALWLESMRKKESKKGKIYLKPDQQPPEGKTLHTGSGGGRYYESGSGTNTPPPSQQDKPSSTHIGTLYESQSGKPVRYVGENNVKDPDTYFRNFHHVDPEITRSIATQKYNEVDQKTIDKIKDMESRLKSQGDTQERHSKSGEYTPERQKVHKEIMDTVLKDYNGKESTSKLFNNDNPTILFFAGASGSGKSKMLEELDKNRFLVLDSDEIKNMLPEYEGYNATEVHNESNDIFKKLLKHAIDNKMNVVVDSTMRNLKRAKKTIKDARAGNYNTMLYATMIKPTSAIERAHARFLKTGRFVPYDYISEAAYMVNDSIMKLKDDDRLDKVTVVSNEVPYGKQPIKLFHKALNDFSWLDERYLDDELLEEETIGDCFEQPAKPITRDMLKQFNSEIQSEIRKELGTFEITKDIDASILQELEKQLYSGVFANLTQTQSELVKQILIDNIDKEISPYDLMKEIEKAIGSAITRDAIDTIIRTEYSAILNKARELNYEKAPHSDTFKYKWMSVPDQRRTIVCANITERTKDGVSMVELKKIIQEEASAYDPNFNIREFSPHYSCRSTFVRIV